MGTLEVEGDNREDALAYGLAQLGLTEAEVRVETVDEGKRFLGILGRSGVRLRLHFDDRSLPAEAAAYVRRRDFERSPGTGSPPPPDRTSEAQEVLGRLIREMGFEAQVEAEIREEAAHLNIQSRELGLLIGRRGETLDALEYLVDRIVNRPPRERVRVVVDAEGYRDRAAEKVRETALALAEKAKRTGKPTACKPMNARDRRLVHTALRDVEGVETHSEGEGAFRRVIISPGL